MSEGQIELLLSATLHVLAIFSNIDAPDISTWFSTRDDAICAVIALLVFSGLIYLPFFVRRLTMELGPNITDDEVMEKYGSILEDHNVKHSSARLFVWMSMMRRLFIVLVLISLDNFPVF